MKWLENVQSKPNHEKIKIVWTICGIVAVLLLVFWIIIGNYRYNTKMDFSQFEEVGKGFDEFKGEFK